MCALGINRIIFSKKFFSLCQRYGFHITPNGFYQPIPDTTKLKSDLWEKHLELVGIDLNEEKQLELLSIFKSQFKSEYELLPRNPTLKPHEYYVDNGAFESVDGEILYCVIRHFKPKKFMKLVQAIPHICLLKPCRQICGKMPLINVSWLRSSPIPMRL